MWVFRQVLDEDSDEYVWHIGYWRPDNTWYTAFERYTEDSAVGIVHYLNGGNSD